MVKLNYRIAHYPLGLHFGIANVLFLTAIMVMMLTLPSHADLERMPLDQRIYVKRLLPETNGGFGYVLEYCVPAPIEAVWRFRTEFESEISLTKMANWDQKLASRYKREYLAALGN